MNTENTRTLHLEIDGGSRNNPGPAAIGVAVLDDRERVVLRHAEAIGTATNNQAEYRALLTGLRLIDARLRNTGASPASCNLRIQTDSRLVEKQIRGEWKTNDESLGDLREAILKRLPEFHAWEITHVPREQNTRADGLVREILEQPEPDGEEPDVPNASPDPAGNDEALKSGPLFRVFAHGVGGTDDDPAGIAYRLQNREGEDLLMRKQPIESVSDNVAVYRAFATAVDTLHDILSHRPEDSDPDKPTPGETALCLYGKNDVVIKQISGEYGCNTADLKRERNRVLEKLNRFRTYRTARSEKEDMEAIQKKAKEARTTSGD